MRGDFKLLCFYSNRSQSFVFLGILELLISLDCNFYTKSSVGIIILQDESAQQKSKAWRGICKYFWANEKVAISDFHSVLLYEPIQCIQNVCHHVCITNSKKWMSSWCMYHQFQIPMPHPDIPPTPNNAPTVKKASLIFTVFTNMLSNIMWKMSH